MLIKPRQERTMGDLETNEEGTPIPQPVTEPSEPAAPSDAGRHQHDWRGMRQAGRSVQMCVFCGKQREREG